MAEKRKSASPKTPSKAKSASRKGTRKTAASKRGPGAGGADKFVDVTEKPARSTARKKAAHTAPASPASPVQARIAPESSTPEKKPSVAARVLKKVRSAAGGLASLAGSVVGRH